MHDPQRLRTTSEIADHFKVHPCTVRRWAALGAPVVRLPGRLRLRLEDIELWCATIHPRLNVDTAERTDDPAQANRTDTAGRTR